jgi:prepilin-type N-terminal cleavage/methylation domain-containing protein
MKRRSRRAFTHRNAFTLIELLIVMMIIAILAAMTYGALFQAQATAREARTKALVAKLHGQMMTRWESYRTRRVPIVIPFGTPPRNAAQMRLQAMRDIIRMELPDKSGDIPATPTNPLARAYRTKMMANGNAAFGTYEAAECLYLILTTSAGEEGLSAYELTNTEVGDFDGDGYKEFHDGWGRPISFIRWPAGLVSDLQPMDPTTGNRNPVKNHDPLDQLKVDPVAFAIVPLIYSAGPDGFYGITPDGNASSNPYADLTIGTPSDSNGDGSLGEDFDNISNHMIGTRQ